MIQSLTFNRALEAYLQLLANKDPDTDRTTIDVISSLAIAFHSHHKPEVAARIIEGFQEHQVAIYCKLLMWAVLQVGDNSPALDYIKKLREADPKGLNLLDHKLLISVVKYAVQTSNADLTAECIKLWTPVDTVFHFLL